MKGRELERKEKGVEEAEMSRKINEERSRRV